MSRHKKENELSDFEVIFIDKWFSNGFNAAAAYRELKPNCSDNTILVEGSNILKKPYIKKYIEKRKEEIKEKEDIKLSYIISELRWVINDAKSDDKTDRVSILKALDQLAKLGGLYVNKTEIKNVGEQPLFGPNK